MKTSILLLIATLGVAAQADEQPNIVIFMVDDLGWNHIGVEQATMGTHGEQYATPHLARLAKEGLSFTHAYAQPNCAPTRAATLTGQYPARIGRSCGTSRRGCGGGGTVG
jgi:arylsulfatase A-like enzyme